MHLKLVDANDGLACVQVATVRSDPHVLRVGIDVRDVGKLATP